VVFACVHSDRARPFVLPCRPPDLVVFQDRSGAVFNKGMKNVDKENRRPLQAAAKSFR
jgi:hypothetical protein